MSSFARRIWIVSAIFVVGTMTCVTGCSADAADAEPTAAAEVDLSATKRAALTAQVKAAYEDSVKNERQEILPGAADVSSSRLCGAAASAYRQYMGNLESYGYGDPTIQVARVGGYTVYIVGGIVSDTGEEMGFYDSRGKKLCASYTGQGQQLNANGVDWWE